MVFRTRLMVTVSAIVVAGGLPATVAAQTTLDAPTPPSQVETPVPTTPAPTAAQTSDTAPSATPADEQPGIGDIVVTAQKRSESINKVGISITAASGDELQQKGVSNASDLIKIVPGFNFTPSAYGAPVYTLRGIGFYETGLAAAPTVSVYVDEVPLPLSLMSTGATLDLERVEVLKGPQGTLFGQNSTGGAINYIAAKPTSTLHAGIDGSYGRFDHTELKGFVSGPLTDTIRVRAAVRWDRQGDWQYSYTRDASRGRSDLLIGRVIADWTPTDRLSISLNVNGWRDRSDTPGAQFVAVGNPSAAVPAALRTYPLPPNDDRAADWDPADGQLRRNVRFFQTSARIDYELSDAAKITSLSSYETIHRSNIVDADGTAIQDFNAVTPGRSYDFSQELRLSGTTGDLRYVFGGNYAYDKIYDQASVQTATSSFPFKAANGVVNQVVNTYAVFGNFDYKIAPTVTLQGGVRYTDQHRAFNGCLYDAGDGGFAALISRVATARTGRAVVVAPGGCGTLGTNFLPAVQYDHLNEDNVSWRGGVNWEVTPRALLYANVSRGYKSGAFPAAGATYSVQFQPARQEHVTAYEAGFKLSLLDRTLQLNGAGFYYDYRDKQLRGKVIDPVLGPLNALINVPKSRIVGGELQVTWQPFRGFVLSGGATYLNTRIQGDFVNFNALALAQNFNGQRLPLTPDWQVVGDGQYTFAVARDVQAFVGGALNHQGQTNGGLGELALFDIASYTLFDARVGVQSNDQRWRATVFVRNLTDKFYLTLVNFPGPDTVVRYAGQPRTFGVTLSYRY